jgi:galactonate dehydratase
MKITRIDTFKHWIEWCNWLIVRVSTDEGLVGWGEGSLHGAVQAVETAIHELGAVLIGQDPGGVAAHWQRMYHAWRWRGGAVQMTALGALDLALWDLEGKRLDVPVARLLGGPFRDRVKVYASHWLSGAESPEQAYDGARDAVARGYTAFKWSPFSREALRRDETGTIARATRLMAAAREGAGDETDIYVECAELLSPRTALLAARAFAPYRPGFFEEPIPFENARALVQLAREMPVPIATGERLLSRWEVRELLESGAVAVIQPDVMHAGGLTEVKRIADLADAAYVSVAPHNPGGPICCLAAMHLAASIPNLSVLEQMENERPIRDSICTHPVICADGFFELPTRPGLGSDVILETLQQRPFSPQPPRDSTDSLWH